MNDSNPFFIKGYHGSRYFCDRESETRKLLSAIRNGRDVTLIAPRRYGKTGLIHNVFAALPKSYAPIYLDIFQLKDLASFTRAFSEKVLEELSTPLERTGKGLLDFFRCCRPTLTPQANGQVSFSVDVVPAQAEATLKDTFAFLESRKVEPVVAIDEFQQVRNFPESGVEALLRSYVQFAHRSHFIFAGSQKHLMEEMFALPRGPFYQSTQLLSLDVIPRESYASFAGRFFKQAGKPFEQEAFDALYDRFDGVTWYVQAVLNRIWDRPLGFDSVETADNVVAELVDENGFVYSDLLRSQTDSAQQILRAIAHEGVVEEVSAKDFVAQYDLPSPSTVRSAVRDLVERDVLFRGPQGYQVYDRFFGIWLRDLPR